MIWDILMGNNDCAKWLDNGKKGSAAELMRVVPIALVNENNPQPLLNPPDATTTSDPKESIDVDRWGRFYADSGNGIRFGDEYTGYYAGSFGARVVILLHELAHKLNPQGLQDDSGPFGLGDTRKSEANTKLVVDKCKDAIDAAAKKP